MYMYILTYIYHIRMYHIIMYVSYKYVCMYMHMALVCRLYSLCVCDSVLKTSGKEGFIVIVY